MTLISETKKWLSYEETLYGWHLPKNPIFNCAVNYISDEIISHKNTACSLKITNNNNKILQESII